MEQPLEPEVAATPVGACRRLVRTVAGRVALAWMFLQLLLHLGVLLHQNGVLDDPLEKAVRQARWTVLSREIAFVWPELPGGRPADGLTLVSLEEWAHHWLASLGAALDVDTWRVIQRTRQPLALGLSGTSPDGIGVELWLQSSPWALGQRPAGDATPAASLTLRLQAGSEAAWEALTARLEGGAWAREWQAYPGPQVLLTYRLQGPRDPSLRAVEDLVQALAARLLGPPAPPGVAAGIAAGASASASARASGGEELWLVTPRAAPLPASFRAHADPRANVRLRWLARDPEAGGGRGRAADAPVLELVSSPHALTSLGQRLRRVTPPHIPGKSWAG